jgi:hypothetical protein
MGNRDMELKNAAAVCLISLVSASLVVLIARALDNQAAGRLEPQLARIADDLHALRKQGVSLGKDNIAPSEDNQAATLENGLIVYYFHGNQRCPTCQSIESQAHDLVQSDFGPQQGRGELLWKILNFEQPAGAALGKKFEVQMPVVVLARMKDGNIEKWVRLDQVWAMVGDKPAFKKYVRGEIERMLAAEKKPKNESKPAKKTPAIPIPK